MITRKAAVGFILLAIIVFPTAYISWNTPLVKDVNSHTVLQQMHVKDNSGGTIVYRPPLVTFDTPFDMAVVVTAIIEVFALLCYLALKRLEPYIMEWEESERERVRDELE